ncbi:MAG: cupin domain-containing protein [Negativicutes bacterium]|nr:cupin domain-containing protein [Negativicutes bacterium]
MYHTTLDKIEGVTINQDINERMIKVLASRRSAIKRDQFTVGVSIIGPGKIHEEHKHDDNQELITVIGGEGVARIDGREFAISQGSVIGLDRGERHGFVNTGKTDLMMLWIYDPPGAEEKFLKGPS